jgi:uncharacterized membrane protein YtjA (UPF0391 family)
MSLGVLTRSNRRRSERRAKWLSYESTMCYLVVASWVIVFLAVALIAAVLGFTATAGTALNIAWILYVVDLILFVVFAGLSRRKRIEGTMAATEGATQVIEVREPAMPSRRRSALTQRLEDERTPHTPRGRINPSCGRGPRSASGTRAPIGSVSIARRTLRLSRAERGLFIPARAVSFSGPRWTPAYCSCANPTAAPASHPSTARLAAPSHSLLRLDRESARASAARARTPDTTTPCRRGSAQARSKRSLGRSGGGLTQ